MFGAWAAMAILVVFLMRGLKILREYERAVVFRLGRLVGARGPGLVYVIPGIEKAIRIDLRTITMDVPLQDVITKDNVSLKVSAVLYFRVIDANRAVTAVENFLFATSQNAQTTLRSVCGEAELDELLAERAAAPLPADPGGGRRGEQLDHHLPGADRHPGAVFREEG